MKISKLKELKTKARKIQMEKNHQKTKTRSFRKASPKLLRSCCKTTIVENMDQTETLKSQRNTQEVIKVSTSKTRQLTQKSRVNTQRG